MNRFYIWQQCSTRGCDGYGSLVVQGLRFCGASCWRRYLVAQAGLWMDWPALTTTTGQTLVESSRRAWLDFARAASDGQIWMAWCAVPMEVRAMADDIDRRPLSEQVPLDMVLLEVA